MKKYPAPDVQVYTKGSEKLSRWILRSVRVAFGPLVRASYRLKVRGAEHLPASGPVIIAANHLSNADPVVLGQALIDRGRTPHFFSKAELFGVPGFRRVLKWIGQIPVWRGTLGAAQSIALAEQYLAEGACVVICPEGTHTRHPQCLVGPTRTGVARLAAGTEVPVVPAVIWGTQFVSPPGRHDLHLRPRQEIIVEFFAPIFVPDGAHPRQATDQIMSGIAERAKYYLARESRTIPPRRPPLGRRVRHRLVRGWAKLIGHAD